MTYEQAVEKIDSLLVFGSKPGLERIAELVRRLGSPDKQLRFVHIAGTNGKGSTCALTAAALTAAGYKTGLFISPYVLEFRERFMIDGEMIPKQILADITEEVWTVSEQMKSEGLIITEFEFVFAVALVWYAREKCDIVVLETGLGGRFDATNIIEKPLVTAITSISLDHTRVLGDTVEKIALEKCGIIKKDGITVAYGCQPDGVSEVIRQSARAADNQLIIANAADASVISSDINGSVFEIPNDGITISIRLIGEHQVKNAMTAYCIIRALCSRGVEISNDAICKGFASVSFPARLELLSRKPLILLDGAHNPGGAEALAAAIRRYLPEKKLVAVAGMLADKDVGTAIGMLAPLFESIAAVSPDNPRKMLPAELAEIIRPYCPDVVPFDDLSIAFDHALSVVPEDGAIVVFGSLYLASDMRKIIISRMG